MLLGILAGVAVVIVLFVIVVATRPGAFRIERSITIAAPAENAFALVNDFHAWSQWSPWEKLDPQMTRSFDGAASGRGAKYGWSSTKEAGEGTMTIDVSDPNKHIAITLQFVKPFKATNAATFTFTPLASEGGADGTRVSWAMEGVRSFGFKAAALFINMDKLVGGDFEKGLATLKTLAETAPSNVRARASA